MEKIKEKGKSMLDALGSLTRYFVERAVEEGVITKTKRGEQHE